MIQALLLDVGNVLVEVDWKNSLEKLGLLEKYDTIHPQIKNWSLHDAYERGRVDDADFFAQLQDYLKLNFSFQELKAAWNACVETEIPGVEELLENLNVPAFVLSNTNPSHSQFYLQKKLFRHFQKSYLSHDLGHRKPEPQIYQKVLQELKLEANSVLFIDDAEDNIASARNLGLHAHVCYRSSEQLREILQQYQLFKE